MRPGEGRRTLPQPRLPSEPSVSGHRAARAGRGLRGREGTHFHGEQRGQAAHSQTAAAARGEGASVMQSWCEQGGALGKKAAGTSSPRTPLRAGLSAATGLGVPGHGVVLPGASPAPPLSPPLPPPRPRGAHLSGTQEIKPSSGQRPPKPWPVAAGGEAAGGRVWQMPAALPGPEAGARHRQGWQLGSLGSSQISVRASAGTRPRFLPLLTRMKPSASLLLPTPTQI